MTTIKKQYESPLKKFFSIILTFSLLFSTLISAKADSVNNNNVELPIIMIEDVEENETYDVPDDCLPYLSVIGKKGDVDQNGELDSYDALLILRCSVGFKDIKKKFLKNADYDEDGQITSLDSLLTLVEYVNAQPPVIKFPDLTVACGDRFYFDAKIVPPSEGIGVTFEYETDDAESTDGSGEWVLDFTNTGKVKAHHPGKSVVTVTASNGLTAKCTVTVVDQITKQTIHVGDNTLNVTKHIMTKNDAYNETDDFEKLDGIVIHSTATPGVMADRWYKAWNKPNTDAAVHAFLDDKGVYQYLPFEQIAWHAGKPCNRTYIDFEICEPSGFYYSNNVMTDYDVKAQQDYFDKIWKNATIYTAYLCTKYGLSSDDILSHAEVGRLGIGTNHGDPDHWFIKHNKTMDGFRKEVKRLMNSGNIYISSPTVVEE